MSTSKTAALLAMGFLLGCTAAAPDETSSPGVPSEGFGVGDAEEPGAPTAHAPQLPMRLRLEGTRTGDVVSLSATVTVVGRLPGAVVMTVRLPEGATLEKGVEQEELGNIAPGAELRREFVVQSTDGVVRVVVRSAGQSSGATASAEWPQQPTPQPQRPVMEPISPVKVYGATVEKAVVVPLDEHSP